MKDDRIFTRAFCKSLLCQKREQSFFKVGPVGNRLAEKRVEMSVSREEFLVQTKELLQLAAMAIALDSRTHLARRGAGEFPIRLSGQKKRTNSGSVRRRPSVRTRPSSERPERRSDRRNLVSLIRDCQPLASFGTATREHGTAILGRHAFAESMTIATTAA